jgi:hypothetical protein
MPERGDSDMMPVRRALERLTTRPWRWRRAEPNSASSSGPPGVSAATRGRQMGGHEMAAAGGADTERDQRARPAALLLTPFAQRQGDALNLPIADASAKDSASRRLGGRRRHSDFLPHGEGVGRGREWDAEVPDVGTSTPSRRRNAYSPRYYDEDAQQAASRGGPAQPAGSTKHVPPPGFALEPLPVGLLKELPEPPVPTLWPLRSRAGSVPGRRPVQRQQPPGRATRRAGLNPFITWVLQNFLTAFSPPPSTRPSGLRRRPRSFTLPGFGAAVARVTVCTRLAGRVRE